MDRIKVDPLPFTAATAAEQMIAAARAKGVREGQRVDRELLLKVAHSAFDAGFSRLLGDAPAGPADFDMIVNHILSKHTQPAPAESEYQRGVREERQRIKLILLSLATTESNTYDAAWNGALDRAWDRINAGVRSQDAAAQDERVRDMRKDCTCLGSCRGPKGLGKGWRCVLGKSPQDERGEGE